MKLIEIVESTHGELPFMGAPCLIVRLSGCNLSCDYCDTPKRNDVNLELSVGEVRDRILSSKLPNVLLTGGEPLLQAKEVEQLMHSMEGIYIVIETNGTLPLRPIITSESTIVMDIKGFKKDFKIEKENLEWLSAIDAVKFISTNVDDWLRNISLFKTLCRINREPIHIFSFSTKQLALNAHKQMIELSKEHPTHKIRMQIQMHKVLGVA